MTSQSEKARAFQALHARPGCFIIPNPWDAGTARLLASLGFEALATTSAGFAFSLGRPDAEGAVNRDETLANARAIVEATDLPVSADLENGFGDPPEVCADTIQHAAAIGLVGGSIEDATGLSAAPIYAFDQAVDRVRAAVHAARSLSFPFMLTARAENYLHGRADLADTIKRLQAFQAAGADVLYAPGLRSREDIATVVRAVDRPVNVVMGLKGPRITVTELAEIGVKRISVGSALARAALGAFMRASREIRERGTFEFASDAVPFAELNALFQPRTR
ncbi:MAG TPA: isocitrate lyase/phosphoenolpyruvate mutase family protein [Alphaproteobacteria bacterium]|nr:isocitrate lyase/phosphoenolpyruvate mutase family protein [Alphaproteobacteria bacterium]